jgi:parallel beta-helix repeat protein
LDSAINGKIENNTISGSVTGVTIENSPGIIIANSTISNTTSGIDVSSPDVLIANNTITGNMGGIKLRSLNATLVSNSLTNNGVYISGGPVDFWKHAIGPDNLVNGKPIGYFWNLTTGIIDGSPYGQVILANCTGIVVNNGIFENSTIGIELGYCTDCNVEGNSISGAWSGIYVESSSENIVSNNNVSESTSCRWCLYHGLLQYYSDREHCC